MAEKRSKADADEESAIKTGGRDCQNSAVGVGRFLQSVSAYIPKRRAKTQIDKKIFVQNFSVDTKVAPSVRCGRLNSGVTSWRYGARRHTCWRDASRLGQLGVTINPEAAPCLVVECQSSKWQRFKGPATEGTGPPLVRPKARRSWVRPVQEDHSRVPNLRSRARGSEWPRRRHWHSGREAPQTSRASTEKPCRP